MGKWCHATMSASGMSPAGFTAPPGYEIIVPEDKTGFFFRLGPARSASSAQTVTTSNYTDGAVRFTWDYGAAMDWQGFSTFDASRVKFRLYAIEMVYIPESSFIAGDATSSAAGATYGFQYGTASTASPPTFLKFSGWPITTENLFNTAYVGAGVGPGTGPYYYYTTTGASGETATGGISTVPSEYPKGYKAFYLMKDEISQGQYRDFLNTLQSAEYFFRCAGAQTAATTGKFCDSAGTSTTTLYRQGVRYISSTASTAAGSAFACAMSSANGVNGSDDGEWVAMNDLSWMDLAAYLDWAGLRPITELEFEKAARGPLAPTPNDYPWGTTENPSPTSTYTALNSSAETGDGRRAEYDGSAGTWPIRVGSFAISASAPVERGLAGAGYYGNLDLAGNVWEMTVNVGTLKGLGFQGSHGDGSLSMDGRGAADNNDWPGFAVGVGVGGLPSGGVGMRGGSWNTTMAPLQISNRSAACDSAKASTRYTDVGGRGGRTAPTFAAPTKPQ